MLIDYRVFLVKINLHDASPSTCGLESMFRGLNPEIGTRNTTTMLSVTTTRSSTKS
ncbi:unnamed protein product [Brassica rapa subsp. trilocularis]